MPSSPRTLRRAVPFPAWLAVAALAGVAAPGPARPATGVEPPRAGEPAIAAPAADPPAPAASPGPATGCASPLTGDAIPSAEQLAAAGATIGTIHVRSHNIFDPSVPGEDFWAFRLANRIHVVTRDRVILNRLVFAPGDPYDERRLAESERLLRRDRFLYDATIRPVAYCDGVVDVEVVTRDVWSLKPAAGFTREGGANSWHVEVQDSNFLGFGTDVTLAYEDTVDRTAALARYRDDDFLGRRLRFELWYSDNSDGDLARLTFERPFRSLDTRSAWGLRTFRQSRVDPLYQLGEVVDRFEVDQELAELSFGRSRGAIAGRAARLRVGATWDDRAFAPAADDPSPGNPLPADRRLAYPWVAGEWIEDGFVESQNLDRIDRTEDLNLGRRGTAWLGLATRALGSDRDAAIFGASWSDGFVPAPGQLGLLAVALGGRLEREGDATPGGLRNGLLSLSLRFYRRNFRQHNFYASLTADAAHELDPEQQLLLGGDSGLRGYPLRYQEGDRRVLLTLEQRFYFAREFFHLVRFGGAVFFDAGKAWTAGDRGPASLGVLRDVGLGLRVGSSRSANAAMIHLDVAFPLDARADGEREVQWLVTTSDTF